MATAGEAPTGPRSGDRRTWVPYPDYPDLVWQYTHFNEPEITSKFEELAQWGTSGDTDYATLQPCTNPYEASQDRHVIHDWEIDGRIWRFRGLFDGEYA
jgi:pyruvate dehydrogenase phosphatase